MTRALRGIGSVSSQQDHEKVNTKDHEKENDKNKNKKESIHPLPISFNNNNNIRTAAYVVNSAVTVTYNITTTLAALGIDVIDSSTNVIPPLVPGSPEEQVCSLTKLLRCYMTNPLPYALAHGPHDLSC